MRGHLRATNNPKVWRAVMTTGYRVRPDGRRVQQLKWVTIRGNRKSAETQIANLVAKVSASEPVGPTKITVAQQVEAWLKVVEQTKRPGTLRTYMVAARHVRESPLGGQRLSSVKPTAIEEWLRKVKVGDATKRLCYVALRAAFKLAVRDGIVTRSPCDAVVDRPASPRRNAEASAKVWTPQQAALFLEAADGSGSPQLAGMMSVLLDAGLRKSELLGLTWADFNEEDRTLTVCRQLDGWGGGAPSLGPTKTKASRTIVLHPETVERVVRHRQQQNQLRLRAGGTYQDHGLMFAVTWAERQRHDDQLGDSLRKGKFRRDWDRVVKAAGLPRIHPHAARHTTATLLLSEGLPVFEVAARLGHSCVATTQGIYGHLLRPGQERAAQAVGAFYERKAR